MQNQQISCLYIEDVNKIREEGLSQLRLKFPDMQFVGAASFDEAIAIYEAQKKSAAFDFVISDFIYPGKDSDDSSRDFKDRAYGGRDFVAHLRHQGDNTPVVIYSGSCPAFIKGKLKAAGVELSNNHIIIVEKSSMLLADIVAVMKRQHTEAAHSIDALPAPLLRLPSKFDQLKAG